MCIRDRDSTATLERIRKNGWDCYEVIEDPEYLFLGSGHPLALTGDVYKRQALRLNRRTQNLTLLSYSYCITGIPEPADT